MIRALAFVCAMLPGLAQAETVDHEDYVISNLLAVFYHELGHALIDVMGLPIYGQEEDAADVLSILMIDEFYDEDAAVRMTYDTADGFLAEAQLAEDIAYWDVHGPDLQRFYTTICLFVGANYDARSHIAEELELPEERLDSCEDEYLLAYDSWGSVLDEIASDNGGDSLAFEAAQPGTPAADLLHSVIADEVNALNAEFRLPEQIDVRIEDCGEANAFYDGHELAIIMCTEFVDHLASNLPAD